MRSSALPAAAGVGFKARHFPDIIEGPQPLGFFEVHAENYMGAGGPPHVQLSALRERYALSIHGVGLSIGSMRPLDREHLLRLKALCERYEPESFSEHLAWSSHSEVYYNDLLPLPYSEETLGRIVEHIDEVQTTLGRQMLLENPSTYLQFAESTIPEVEFLREVSSRTGCGLLLDVNNVFVQAKNHGTNARDYLNGFPLERVREIHLGGHAEQADDAGAPLLIDAHGTPVAEPVWTLYGEVIVCTGPVATLIEWDNDVPAWPVLRAEAERAGAVLERAFLSADDERSTSAAKSTRNPFPASGGGWRARAQRERAGWGTSERMARDSHPAAHSTQKFDRADSVRGDPPPFRGRDEKVA